MIQPQVLLQLPCYALTPITDFTLDACFLAVGTAVLGALSSHSLAGGVYKTRERIHGDMLIRHY